ncbi:MAG: helicase C-terminal domain-containing protein [Gemmatimonadaceae bacterium]
MIAPLDLVAAATRMVLDDYAAEETPPHATEHVTEHVTEHLRELRALDPVAVSADLGPDGPIARAMERFEDRPTQRAMAHAVVDLYNSGGVGLLEAGTGVGKSLGYLVPALRWAAANGERTVVSTNTINLQEQLVRKDLPFLRDALASEQSVRFALLKGWRNYLCKLRLAQATLLGPTLVDDDAGEALEEIRAWSETTEDGSLSDLATPPRGEVWDEVAAEPDLCTRNACPHFQDCFLFKARREAAQADVVVVNHHLLMSDVAVRRAAGNWDDAAVIPPYTRLVIDEGHHLEDAASAHLGVTTSRRALQRLFGRLDRRGRGLVNTLVERLSASRDLLGTASLDVVTQRIVPAVRASREKSELLFDLLLAVLHTGSTPVMRMADDFAVHPVWKGGLHIALTDLLRELRVLGDSLTLVGDRLQGGGQRDDTLLMLVNELRAVARRLDASAEGLMLALRPPATAEPMVRWLEIKGREGNVAVTAVPLDLAPILRDDLFTRVKTAVVTSATLGTEGDFAFVARRFGLDGGGAITPITAAFASPFDYQSQALMIVPTDIPAPNEDAASHFNAVVRIVAGVARASRGGMFVLFTSHRDVRAAAESLRNSGLADEYTLLVHGEDGRDALLARFRTSGNAILLGTSSYWEGVDVPGSALRALVIARLPFRVPSEPVTAAQCEAITARGGDAFAEYMLPHASLRLKQGFGRLIRTASDRGAIVIADPRVITKRYGRELLRDLPPARRMSGAWSALERQLERFYGMS